MGRSHSEARLTAMLAVAAATAFACVSKVRDTPDQSTRCVLPGIRAERSGAGEKPDHRLQRLPRGRGRVNRRTGSGLGWSWGNVRFTPESGHGEALLGCPLCAKSGHSALQQNALKNPKMYSVCWVNNRYFERAFTGSLTLSTLAISTLRT